MATVVRAVVFEYEEVGEERAVATAPGIGRWLGAGGARVEVAAVALRVSRVGLAVQKPPDAGVRVYWEPVARVVGLGPRLCRFHEGPPGAVEEQLYCVRRATTPSGFCEEHASSPLALFERCAAGDDDACLRVSAAWPRESYAIYVLDYGGERVKVGLTRSWRLIWRLAEQPHVAAAVVKTVEGDAYAARSFERELSRHRLATEGPGVRVHDRLVMAASFIERYGVARAAPRMAEHLARLGLAGSFRAYTVLPRTSPRAFLEARRCGPRDLVGRRLVVVDYWAGLLLVEDLDTGERLAVAKRDIQHLVLHTARD